MSLRSHTALASPALAFAAVLLVAGSTATQPAVAAGEPKGTATCEKRIGDKRLLGLIRRYLEAGIMAEGVVMARHEGTPQGGPLSPLLANVLLDDVDKELEKRGLAFVRYADDRAPRRRREEAVM